MTQRLTPGTAALLVTAPLLWAGNAVVGRLVHAMIPPITLNFFRWVLAFAILLPLAHGVLRKDSPLWPHWRRYAVLGLLGIGYPESLGGTPVPHAIKTALWTAFARHGTSGGVLASLFSHNIGLPPVIVEAMLSLYHAAAAGEYALVTDHASRLAGRPLTPMREYVLQHLRRGA